MPIIPTTIIKEINNKFNGEAIICADASFASGWVGDYGYSNGKSRNIIIPRGTGNLGLGLPATIAAKIAWPGKQVFEIGGDAGFAMSCHEIETACRLDIHYFILNNNKLGMLEKKLIYKYDNKKVLDICKFKNKTTKI